MKKNLENISKDEDQSIIGGMTFYILSYPVYDAAKTGVKSRN